MISKDIKKERIGLSFIGRKQYFLRLKIWIRFNKFKLEIALFYYAITKYINMLLIVVNVVPGAWMFTSFTQNFK